MRKAFTLVELLVVMGIIGILVSLFASNFRNAQIRGRDAQRKSDLKQISNSLELYYADYKKYPDPDLLDLISGEGEFTDGKTVYFKRLPKDPAKNYNYYYNIVKLDIGDTSNQKYQLFAHLENDNDLDADDRITKDECGGDICNFSITSPNTSPFE